MQPFPQSDELQGHEAFLRRLAQRLIGDPEQAEDVVQEAFLIALKSSRELNGSLQPWLVRVTRNLAANVHRRTERRNRAECERALSVNLPATAELVAEASVRRALARSVLELEEPYRSVLLQHFYEGLPPREIARKLEVPVETVRTRIKRGVHQIRARLDSEGVREEWLESLVGFARLRTRGLPSAAKILSATALAGLVLGLLFALGFFDRKPSDSPGNPLIAGAATQAGDESRVPLNESVAREPVSLATRPLRLEVVRARDGSPVSGAKVVLEGSGRDSGQTTDKNGSVSFPWLQGELLELEVAATTDTRSQRVRWQPDLLGTELTVRVEEGCSIEGQLRANGQPVPGGLVHLWEGRFLPLDQARPAPLLTVNADQQGRFQCFDLPLELYAEAEGSGLVPRESLVLSVDRGQAIRGLELVLDDERTVLGRVLGDRGEAFEGVRVQAIACDTDGLQVRPSSVAGVVFQVRVRQSALSQPDGSFRLEGLPSVPLFLRVTREGLQTRRFFLSTDETSRDLTLAAGITQVVRVEDPSGRAVEGALVHVAGLSGGALSASTGPDGSAVFPNLHPDRRVFAYAEAVGFGRVLHPVWIPMEKGEVLLRLARQRSLTLHVADQGGAPLGGATVSFRLAWPAEAGEILGRGNMMPARFLAEGRSDASGVLAFDHLPDAPLEVAVELSGQDGRFFDLAPGITEAEFRLTPLPSKNRLISGTVSAPARASWDGLEVVALEREAPRRRILTAVSPTGAFGFQLPGSNGWYLYAFGQEWARSLLELPPGSDPVDVQIELFPQRSLSLEVQDASGHPLSGGIVRFEGANGQPLLVGMQPGVEQSFVGLDSEGRAHAHGLPATRLRVCLVAAGGEDTRELDLSFDGSEDLLWTTPWNLDRPSIRLALKEQHGGTSVFFQGPCTITQLDSLGRILSEENWIISDSLNSGRPEKQAFLALRNGKGELIGMRELLLEGRIEYMTRGVDPEGNGVVSTCLMDGATRIEARSGDGDSSLVGSSDLEQPLAGQTLTLVLRHPR